MNKRLALIRQRHQLLLTRVAVQRLTVVQQLDVWRTPLAVLDAVFTTSRMLLRHPWVLAFAAMLLLRAPHRRFTLWSAHLITIWNLYRTVQGEWSRTRSP